MPLRSKIPSRHKWFPSPSDSESDRRTRSLTLSPLSKSVARLYTKFQALGSKESESKPSGNYVQCNGTATNIFSLPVELLVEIFLMARNGRMLQFTRAAVPLNITQTCRLWRAISLGAPQLWTTFWVCLNMSPKILELWFDRANGNPLNVNLSYLEALCTQDTPGVSRREARVWEIVILHAAELEHLRFIAGFRHPTFLPSLQPGMFTGLKSVDWVTMHGEDDSIVSRVYEGFWDNTCSAPLLQKAKLSQIPKKAPWSQFTELELHSSPFLPAIRALSQCQNLTKLCWRGMHDDGNYIIQTPILLPKLLDLSVFISGAITDSIFNCLHLPSLSQLHVGCFDDMIFQPVRRLLDRSNAKLRYFRASQTDTQSLLRLLETPLLSDLCRLSISVLNEPQEFWKALANPSFLPCMNELQLTTLKRNNMNLIERSFQIRQRGLPDERKLIRVTVSIYDPRPNRTRFDSDRQEMIEILRAIEAWHVLSKKLQDSLVLVDVSPCAYS